jgi:hypothetical protein
MISTKVIAVVLAVIVVAGGVTAVVIYNNNNKGTTDETELNLQSADVKACLEVYGNVNEDAVIDAKDKEALTKAIADGKTSDYKYADANFDGVVNDADVDYIQSIIDATYGSPVAVKHLCRYTKGDYYNVSQVPINAIVMTGAANMFAMVKYLGLGAPDASNPIKAIAYSGTIDKTLYPEYQGFFSSNDYNVGTIKDGKNAGSAGYFNIERVTNHVISEGVKAIFTADNASSYLSGANDKNPNCYDEKGAIDAGLFVFRFAHASCDMHKYLSDLALMQFALGIDTDIIPALEAWCGSFFSDLNEKLESHIGKDTKQVKVAVTSSVEYKKEKDGTITTYNYISSDTSDYTDVSNSAGGYFALKGFDFKGSSSSPKMTDLGEWLADYKIDKIVHVKTGSGFSWYGGDAITKGKDTLTKGPNALQKTSAFYNNEIYVITGDAPVPIRIAYMAHVLYPEIFSEQWALNYNISLCKLIGINADTVKNGIYFVDMEDLGLKGDSTA